MQGAVSGSSTGTSRNSFLNTRQGQTFHPQFIQKVSAFWKMDKLFSHKILGSISSPKCSYTIHYENGSSIHSSNSCRIRTLVTSNRPLEISYSYLTEGVEVSNTLDISRIASTSGVINLGALPVLPVISTPRTIQVEFLDAVTGKKIAPSSNFRAFQGLSSLSS